ncbi:vacuolar-sorting protein snf7-like [Camellia sinensis]|uniref:vacuolar-sorting protein snf7-like n=1 Tax=Camellia sinensis TaxID=4442 RepID=UPI001036E848|nr:vacuolar-sorting protein snf7-like [Camellia sinensis]
MASDSADDINVGVTLCTVLLLPGDLERNAQYSEYENYALMLQHFVQSFENRERLAEMKREVSSLQKTNKGLQSKMKKLEDQAEEAIKAQTEADEKAEAAEAIRKVAKSQRREAEEKMAQAEKELQKALATKEVEIKDADEKAYSQGMADVTEAYEKQVKEADTIPLPFPPALTPSEDIGESDAEDEAKEEEDEAECHSYKE